MCVGVLNWNSNVAKVVAYFGMLLKHIGFRSSYSSIFLLKKRLNMMWRPSCQRDTNRMHLKLWTMCGITNAKCISFGRFLFRKNVNVPSMCDFGYISFFRNRQFTPIKWRFIYVVQWFSFHRFCFLSSVTIVYSRQWMIYGDGNLKIGFIVCEFNTLIR